MPAIAGRCTEVMGMATRMGAWQRFLPRSEAPGPPRCLAVKLVSPVIRDNRKSWGHVLYHRRAKPPLSKS